MKATTIIKKYGYITPAMAEELTDCTPSVLEKVNKMLMLGYCRPCKLQGSGRHTHNVDLTFRVKDAFKKLGINVELVNDSPRGGLCGNILYFVGNETWKVIDNVNGHFGVQFNDLQLVIHTTTYLPQKVREAYNHLCGEA